MSKLEQMLRVGEAYDRRRKLSNKERAEIRELRLTTSLSYAKIAALYDVSKTLIMSICDEDFDKRCRLARQERAKDGRYKKPRHERAAIMREHRRYKMGLHRRGLI